MLNEYEKEYYFLKYKPVIIGLLIALVIALIVLVVIWAVRKYKNYIRKKYENLVIQTSKRYKAISWLNSTYDFHENLKALYDLYWTVNSKAQLDRFNFWQKFKDEISTRPEQYQNLLDLANENDRTYAKYQKDIEALPTYTAPEAEYIKGYSYKKYSFYEHDICDHELLDPITFIEFRCTVEYTSPAGRNWYEQYQIFGHDQIQQLLDEVEDDYRRRDTAAYQRSLMTPTLRYDVMKRDGFKCVLCGRSADDGVKLHVDHILPVAKGGKTVMSNLRTLCEDCNLGKSDKYDEYGPN